MIKLICLTQIAFFQIKVGKSISIICVGYLYTQKCESFLHQLGYDMSRIHNDTIMFCSVYIIRRVFYLAEKNYSLIML